jgi:hypothetical protein
LESAKILRAISVTWRRVEFCGGGASFTRLGAPLQKVG